MSSRSRQRHTRLTDLSRPPDTNLVDAIATRRAWLPTRDDIVAAVKVEFYSRRTRRLVLTVDVFRLTNGQNEVWEDTQPDADDPRPDDFRPAHEDWAEALDGLVDAVIAGAYPVAVTLTLPSRPDLRLVN